MKGKNKGFSLVELIVVIAIMAVAMTVSGFLLSTISLANAKDCATEIQSELELLRMETNRNVEGNVHGLRIFKDDGNIYKENVKIAADGIVTSAGNKEEIGSSAVTIKYTDDAGDTKTLDEAGLVFSFKKSTGGFDRFDAKKIVVTGASREYTITCYKLTGKVTME